MVYDVQEKNSKALPLTPSETIENSVKALIVSWDNVCLFCSCYFVYT